MNELILSIILVAHRCGSSHMLNIGNQEKVQLNAFPFFIVSQSELIGELCKAFILIIGVNLSY